MFEVAGLGCQKSAVELAELARKMWRQFRKALARTRFDERADQQQVE